MMAVRGMLLSLAENGVFSTLGYDTRPSPELVKEMDAYYQQLKDFTRAMLRKHADKVHALAKGLVDKDELDTEAVTAILGPRPGEPEATSQ
jgi:ATP-dependent Zn protease